MRSPAPFPEFVAKAIRERGGDPARVTDWECNDDQTDFRIQFEGSSAYHHFEFPGKDARKKEET